MGVFMSEKMRALRSLILSRRGLLRTAGGAAAAGALAACGKPQDTCSVFICDGDLKGVPDMAQACAADSFVVPRIDTIGIGQVLVVGQEQAFIHRTADGYAAIRDRCTHAGCGVNHNPGAQSYDCVCHGSRFNLDGSVKNGPAAIPLRWFAACREGNNLIVSRTNLIAPGARVK
jgi:Rieske Fe-S protein